MEMQLTDFEMQLFYVYCLPNMNNLTFDLNLLKILISRVDFIKYAAQGISSFEGIWRRLRWKLVVME